ncbi:uncharacterized protein LOC130828480 [Amaranthus tricolor]|uniref:uncharacterized protein LOC130828480 n=1 Tax=Amaranthus tricolor TaxID=29722 RepID=UPI002583B111|nr:uncharacterized protein LOC130828480 [Amaranthus tricolor]
MMIEIKELRVIRSELTEFAERTSRRNDREKDHRKDVDGSHYCPPARPHHATAERRLLLACSITDVVSVAACCLLWVARASKEASIQKFMSSSGASGSDSCNVSGDATNEEGDFGSYPLWKYVVKGDKMSGGGERQVEQYIESRQPKRPPLPSQSLSSETSLSPTSYAKKRKSDNPITKAFDIQARNNLDVEIARMFFTGGLIFNLCRNPYYVSSYNYAATNNIPGYKPPGYNKMRTALLDREKENVEKLLEPTKATWREKGVSILSDGWSDPQRRPLINLMVACEVGPLFLKVVDCSEEVKDKDFIASLLNDAIEEVGYDKFVVQILTDNASNCKAAGELIEGRYPHIFWTPCIVHTLNLALKNICNAKNVSNNEELLSVGDTRFALLVVMLKRMKLLKTTLQSMVFSEAWSTYHDDHRGQATLVREKILNDDWWDNVDYILDFTCPIYDMIRACDTDKASLHLVYEKWDSMISKVKEIIYNHEHKQRHEYSSFFSVVETILLSRWKKSNSPLHCLAHSLNPRYYSDTWLKEVPGRVASHVDNEISTQRFNCFRRLFQDLEDRRKVNMEYAIFSARDGGVFTEPECLNDMYLMAPKHWWATYGSQVPMLQALAFKLLGQPSSSSCCERNWSTYKFIHSCTRNKLAPKRAQDLVYIHNNLRLLSRRGEAYNKGRTRLWDVGKDDFGNLEDSICLGMADLSLDEPELETTFVTEDDDGYYMNDV